LPSGVILIPRGEAFGACPRPLMSIASGIRYLIRSEVTARKTALWSLPPALPGGGPLERFLGGLVGAPAFGRTAILSAFHVNLLIA